MTAASMPLVLILLLGGARSGKSDLAGAARRRAAGSGDR